MSARTLALAALASTTWWPTHAHGADPIGHKAPLLSKMSSAEQAAALEAGDRYRRFVHAHRTEREVVAAVRTLAEKAGFAPLGDSGKPAAGKRVFLDLHGKAIGLAIVGRRPIAAGVRVLAAHIDAVRIDLKQNPVYGDANLGLLQTHYYGSIKPYQWLSTPLELRGVVVTKAGRRVDVRIGSGPDDPLLVIPDLLTHLVDGDVDSEEGESVPAEKLDPIAWATPKGDVEDPFAAGLMAALTGQLGIEAADLISSELQLVPAHPARDVGLDRMLIGAYGQDDRACAWAAFEALTTLDAVPQHTAVVWLVDKEEIGSTGNTGARGPMLGRLVGELAARQAGGRWTEQRLRDAFAVSKGLSIDVTSAANPHYTDVYEPTNMAFMGAGPVLDHSGVHAEFTAHVRSLLDRAGVRYQTGLFSRVTESKNEDGTVLPFLTALGMDAMDFSLPLLSMHAPYELVSKVDLYEATRAYRAFLLDDTKP